MASVQAVSSQEGYAQAVLVSGLAFFGCGAGWHWLQLNYADA